LEKIFEKEDRGVFLPYREFLDLWNKLNLPADLKKNTPPVDGVLASARYVGRVEGEAAIFDAQLQLEALKEGWSKVPLGGADLNIAEIKSKAILRLGDAGYEAILPEKGSYPVTLTVLGKVVRETGRHTLNLRLPRTAALQFELTIPDWGLEFTLRPASAFTAKEENGATKLTAFFGSTQEAAISWQKRAAESALPALIFAESALDATISPGALRTTVEVQFRILRAGVNAFELLVPAGQQVLSVEGDTLRDWNLTAAPDGRQRLGVNLTAPARNRYTLRITLEAPIPNLPAKLEAPVIEIAGAEGQSGTVSVSADPSLNVTLEPGAGLTQQASAEPATSKSAAANAAPSRPPRSGALGVFRFLRLPYALGISAQAAEPVVEVTSAALLTVEPDALGLRANLSYKVRKAGIFTAQIDLPAAFSNVEAQGDPVESSAIVANAPGIPAGMQRLEVRFKERRTGEFAFSLKAEAPRSKPDEPVSVTALHPVGAVRHEGRMSVAVHQSLDANTAASGDLRQDDIASLDAPPPEKPDVTPLTLGFRYRGEAAKPAQLGFTLRRPRVSAEVRSVVQLRESLVRYRWQVVCRIEYAGIDELTLDAPPDLAADLQFTGPDIKEKTLVEENDPAGKPTGRKLWRIRLQQKKLGEYVLEVSVERPLPPLAAGKSASVDWPELKTVGLFRETGQVAVLKEGNLEITRSTPQGLELIDPKELGPVPQMPADGDKGPGDVFLAYRYAAHPAALKLEFSKNQFLPVPSALVTYAVINTVLTPDRAETTEVIYWVRNNAQQFFSVALPARGQMLSDVFVNGQPQQPARRPDKNELLIRLPARTAAASESEAPFSVRFVYSVPSPKPGSGLWPRGSLRVEPPVLAEARILQTQYSLYLPTGYRYIGFSGPMREDYGERGWSRLRNWLDPLVPTLGPDIVREPSAEWQAPPELPPATGGFDSQLPKEGQPAVLHRLDAPAPVTISYRSLAYANTVEALAFFLALGGGLFLLGSSRGARVTYFFIVGVGALILAGAVAPRAAGLWTAVYLGVFAAVGCWVLCRFSKWVRRVAAGISERRRRLAEWAFKKTPRPPTTPPSSPPSAPPSSNPPPSPESGSAAI
jgi:hypothetical protein